MAAKILILDIETAPIKASVWGLWKNNVALNQIDKDWYILTWAAKWFRDRNVYTSSLFDHPRYVPGTENDYHLLKGIKTLLDEADIVVAHNGRQFDIKKLNARFLKHNIKPPSPFKQVDTLEVAKRNFRLTSNKLDYIANLMGLGGKEDTGGMALWNDCIAGKASAFAKMLKYNAKDVTLLESVYIRLLPWINTHPNMGLYTEEENQVCPTCGSSHLNFRGYAYTAAGKYHRFVCKSCGHWGRDRTNVLPKAKRKGLMSHVI